MDLDRLLATSNVAQAAPDVVRRIPHIQALFLGCRLIAPAFTCRCGAGDNLALHRALQRASAGQAIVCDAGGRINVGHFGELMGRDAQNRGIRGLIINGSVRDSEDLQKIGFPVFCMGTAPFQSTKTMEERVGEPITINGVQVNPGDMIVADGDAVITVPHAAWETTRERALEIAAREEHIRVAMKQGRSLADLLAL